MPRLFAGFMLSVILAGCWVPASSRLAAAKDITAPMTFTIVRSTEKGCELHCPEWLMADGQIMRGSPLEFRKILDRLEGRKLPVVLRSPGGNMIAALEIGYMLRRAGLPATVGRTMYKGCAPSDSGCKLPAAQKGIYRGRVVSIGSYCVSACPMVLAAGVRRLASPKAVVGVHQIRLLAEDEGSAQQGKAKPDGKPDFVPSTPQLKTFMGNLLSGYLNAMGVSVDLLADMEKASGEAIYRLSSKRRAALKLTTEKGGAEILVTQKPE
jgi:hypothetical protein